MLKFLQYRITTSLPTNVASSKLLINTINPHSHCVAKKDSEFENSLISCDLLIPDGIGIVLAFRVLYGKKIDRISGSDLHMHYLNLVSQKSGKVFYLGSNESTLISIQQKINNQFPSIQVETFSPPFKTEFTNEDNHEMLAIVNLFKPDVLFIGMTAPKQEKWAYRFKDQLDAQVICSIGAVFDFYAGTVKRPSEVWINLGLEWLPRLIREPRRLWKRTFISTPIFIFDILLSKAHQKNL